MRLFTEYDDVQGLVRFGHARLTEARYWLVRIKSPTAARAWLSSAPITSSAKTATRPSSALQVAFTAAGLRALGVAEDLIQAFAPEFLAGMAEPARARRLGDVGPNAPSVWTWGVGEREPHLIVMLFALPGGLDAWETQAMGPAAAEAFDVVDQLQTGNLDGVEPFGFVDGISQPGLDWDREYPIVADQLDYTNVFPLGEILLGYPNHYDQFTPRPLVDAADPLADLLPPSEEQPAVRDLGRNGTYLVVRQLEQDVRGFWQSVDKHAAQAGVAPTQLAESMVGRRLDGTPLVQLSTQPIPDLDPDAATLVPSNRFTYLGDVEGDACPVGSHIRRANPRNTDYPAGTRGIVLQVLRLLGLAISGERTDAVASTRFHRLLRRGREYGPGLSPEDARQPGPTDDPPRGLQFACLNANLARQFEFVQGAWLMGAAFDGTHNETDPLLGHRQPGPDGAATDTFSMPLPDGVCGRVDGLPTFVTVKGGAYFFMPGLRALSYLIRASGQTQDVSR